MAEIKGANGPANSVGRPATQSQAKPATTGDRSQPEKIKVNPQRSVLLGAMFLMATSAIGPGFITQTTTFTVQLGVAMAFAILASILVDIAVQMNVWRVLGVSGMRANELGNKILPGLGWVLAILVLIGGFVFNIGNVAGTGLGLKSIFTGLDPRIGAAISACIAIGIFLVKQAGPIVDRVVVVLGMVMIVMTLVIAIITKPPVGQAVVNMFVPEKFDFVAITTLIGGTVGGYITYAGAHRLIDSGVTGPENSKRISNGSVTGIIVTGVMRFLLFLAILGVVVAGATLDPKNPAASAFEYAAGTFGRVVFGIIFWAAAITSVIGASYTSISFVTKPDTPARTRNLLTVGFIVITASLYLIIGAAPVQVLVFAGLFNGLILPIGFTVILIAMFFRADLLRGYVYPIWLKIVGVLAWLLTIYLGVNAIIVWYGKVFG